MHLLITATKPEWQGLQKSFHFVHCKRTGLYRSHVFKEIYLGQIGMGVERAQSQMEALFCALPKVPDFVLHFGVSGGLKPGFKPGTLILPTCFVEENHKTLLPSPSSLKQARKILDLKAYVEGSLLTSSVVLSDEQTKSKAGQTYQAIAVDMETFPVASFVLEKKIPFLSVRSLFDPMEWDINNLEKAQFMSAQGDLKTFHTVKQILTQGKLWKSMPRYLAAFQKATNPLTDFIFNFLTVLEEPEKRW